MEKLEANPPLIIPVVQESNLGNVSERKGVASERREEREIRKEGTGRRVTFALPLTAFTPRTRPHPDSRAVASVGSNERPEEHLDSYRYRVHSPRGCGSLLMCVYRTAIFALRDIHIYSENIDGVANLLRVESRPTLPIG